MEFLPMTGKVAVYGTLKRGYSNNHILKNSEFIGKAITLKKYPMVDVGFPYVFNLPDNGFNVKCEIFDIVNENTMLRLDTLEGHPYHYIRTLIDFKLLKEDENESNEVTYQEDIIQAFIYFNSSSIDELFSPMENVEQYFISEW